MIAHSWRHLRPLLPGPGRRDLAVFAVASALAGLVEAILMVIVGSVALALVAGDDEVELSLPGLAGHDPSLMGALLTAALGGVCLLLLHLHSSAVASRLPSLALHTARERAVRAYMRAPWENQSAEGEGVFQETVSTLATQSAAMVMHLCTFVSAALSLAVLFAVALAVDAAAILAAVVLGAGLVLALKPIRSLTRRRATVFVNANSAWVEQSGEWAGLALELRAFGVDGQRADMLLDESGRVATVLRQSNFASRFGSVMFRDLAILLLVAGMVLVAAADVGNVGAVGAVVLLVVRALSYAQVANFASQSINELAPNLSSLTTRLEALESVRHPDGKSKPLNVGTIRLEDVSYNFSDGSPGLADVSLSIEEGECIGIIGPSGGGKTTFVQLLLGLRQPTSGALTVDGVALSDIDQSIWREFSAFVPQDPRLFQGSIEENVAFFRSGVPSELVGRALEAAHLTEEIARLPAGCGTLVGPRGAGLSGGQRQRIAVARALVGRPRLLVLDEPTSALDVASEQALAATIIALKGTATMVIVAHRLSTLACCDRVVALKDGRVQRVGTLAEAAETVSFFDPGAAEAASLSSEDGEEQ